jgi:hypothetical protein
MVDSKLVPQLAVPLWFQLLKLQGEKKTGLTIPFLIGATHSFSTSFPVVDDNLAFDQLSSMLIEMRDVSKRLILAA